MDIHGIGRTDVGLIREGNEDVFVVDVELGLYAVCDGMGGHAAGEVAAEMTANSVERSIREQSDVIARVEHDPNHAGDLSAVVVDALRRACQEVHAKASSDAGLAGMGCTATVLVTAGGKAVMAHVGDTRLYLLRSGQAHQLSSDHTMAAELVRQGAIDADAGRAHPHAHVLTRAIGLHPLVDIETLAFDLVPGDRMVLCSDGLADYIPSPAWLAEQVSMRTVEDLPDDLVSFALEAGGHDNVTVVAVEVEGELELTTDPPLSTELLLEILGSSFLFSGLSLAQLSRVLERAELMTYDAETVVRSYGDVQTELLVVIRGAVRVEAADGRSALVGPGQHLGEALVLRPRPIRAKLVANGTATLLEIDGSSLLDLINRRPWLGVALLPRFVERLSAEIDRMADTQQRSGSTVAADLL